ncbi:hypothetical protein AB1Y20_001685 [Prymnesium parvum]|uniref:MYND-type domain-containing protein n=1 Tax=Prymnesium parvum TaxID=97485 RepID=A0AB34K8G4_PRYPA
MDAGGSDHPAHQRVSPGAVFGAAKRQRANEAHVADNDLARAHLAVPLPAARRVKANYEEWRAECLAEDHLRDVFFGAGHKCRNIQPSGDACHIGLWGGDLSQLRKHLTLCLPQRRGRATEVGRLYDSAARHAQILNHLLAANEQGGKGPYVYLVNGRQVCAAIFAAHWGISRATLQRVVVEARNMQVGVIPCARLEKHARETVKRDYIVAWVRQYAELVTEKLPDSNMLLIPRISWKEFYNEYEEDMRAAGAAHSICTMVHFIKTFKESPELQDVSMNRHKKNFGKCGECVELCAKVSSALQGHDAAAVAEAKTRRLEHYGLAKADKINYYTQREGARQPHSIKMTLIIDKMDSAKNHIPWYSNGRKPKDCEELLKNAMKLHVTGIIIHGRPDKRYLYWSLPFLPGNANLNIECLRRALLKHIGDSGTMKPKLYVQVDNASDNKNFTTLVMFAWLVHHEYVSQREALQWEAAGLLERWGAEWRFTPPCPDEALYDALSVPLGGGSHPLFSAGDPWRRRAALRDFCRGRGLELCAACAPGDLLLREEALAAVLYRGAWRTHCHFCLRAARPPAARCPRGCEAYCSAACAGGAWAAGHRRECGRRYFPSRCPRTVLLCARALAAEAARGGRRAGASLGSHAESFGAPLASQLRLHAHVARRVLFAEEAEAEAEGEEEGEEAADTWEQEMLRLLCAAMTNVFTVSEMAAADDGSASAIFSTASMLNHSCAPNTSLRFHGRTLELRASRHLHAEQVYTCYGPQSGYLPVERRRAELRRTHYFTCRCEACVREERGDVEARRRAASLDARAKDACDGGRYDAAARYSRRALRLLRIVFPPGAVQLAYEEAKLARLMFNAGAGANAAEALHAAANSLMAHGEQEEALDLRRLASLSVLDAGN